MNYTTLAEAAGISRPTAVSWLSVLETSFVVYQVQPYFKNFKKRVVKAPKLYFRDTGLACALLRIPSPKALQTYYQRGALFENFVFNEAAKAFYNLGKRPPLYYWRDNAQREIDLLIDQGVSLRPVEIKSGTTYQRDFFRHLDWFATTATEPLDRPTVIYGGDEDWDAEAGRLLSWRTIASLADPPPLPPS